MVKTARARSMLGLFAVLVTGACSELPTAATVPLQYGISVVDPTPRFQRPLASILADLVRVVGFKIIHVRISA